MNFLNKKTIFNLPLYKLVLVSINIVLVTVFAIIYKEPVFKMIPLYVSVIVMLMQTGGNRYALLLGSLNSIVYAVVYFLFMKTPGGAISALLISFPLQLIGFINWSRRPYGNSTIFKRFGKKEAVASPFVFGAIVTIYWLLTVKLGIFESSFPALDITTSALGTFITVLQLMSYVEYVYLNIVSGTITIVLNVRILMSGMPGHATYVVQSVYTLICIIITAFTLTKLYNEQHKKGETR